MKFVYSSLLLLISIPSFASYVCKPQTDSVFYDICFQSVKLTLDATNSKLTIADQTEDCRAIEDEGDVEEGYKTKYGQYFSDSGCWLYVIPSARILKGEKTGKFTFLSGGECGGDRFIYTCTKL